MSTPDAPQTARTVRAFQWLGYGLVFLLLACAVMVIANLIRTAWPEWRSGTIAGIMLFVVAERLYTHRHLKTLNPWSSEWALAIGGQWILTILVARLLLAFVGGLDTLRSELLLFARGDLAAFFTPELVIPLFPAAMLWYLAAQFLELLDEIGLDASHPLLEGAAPSQSDVAPAQQRLVGLVFSLGIAVIVVTVLTRLNLRTMMANESGFPDVQLSRFSGAEGWALLYFVLGLTLLSLGRLMSLQAHWSRLRIPVSSPDLVRRWGTYSLVFLLVLGVFIGLLPAGDSFGLLSVLGSLLGFVIGVLFFLGQVLIALFALLLSLPLSLLGRGGEPMNEMPAPPPLPNLPAPPSTSVEENAAWMLVRSVLLWGALLALIVFAVRQFVQQHEDLRDLLGKSRLARWLALAWQWLYRNVDRTRSGFGRAIAEGWQGLRSRWDGRRTLPRPPLMRLRNLDPRRQIYFFYLAMIRRAGEQGMGRKPSETPSEYAAQLTRELPLAENDIDSLTQAFMAARYSQQDVDRRQADEVKTIWGRLRQAFQARARNERSAKK